LQIGRAANAPDTPGAGGRAFPQSGTRNLTHHAGPADAQFQCTQRACQAQIVNSAVGMMYFIHASGGNAPVAARFCGFTLALAKSVAFL
jgi:hypothetical protein